LLVERDKLPIISKKRDWDNTPISKGMSLLDKVNFALIGRKLIKYLTPKKDKRFRNILVSWRSGSVPSKRRKTP
jgi:hypothetical protein